MEILCFTEKEWQYKKKVFNCFDFSTTVTHGAYTTFELMK